MSTISNATTLADQFITMWNEADGDRRAELIAGLWSEEGSFVDPILEATGHDGLNGMVEKAQQMFPGHSFKLVSEVDTHHNYLRWTWELAAEGQPAVAGGTDFATLDIDGKLGEVVGFINFAPAG